MKKTKIISFPRSGHCLIAMILSNYFGKEFKYCERYMNPELVIEKNEETNIQKEHDFDLDVPCNIGVNYIVQIRNPLYSIPSWYSLMKLQKIEWRDFSEYALDFWNKFVDKWIILRKQKIPVIYYEDLVLNPKENLIKIILTIKTESINYEHLEDCIKRENIKPRPHSFIPEKEWEIRAKNSIKLYEEIKKDGAYV